MAHKYPITRGKYAYGISHHIPNEDEIQLEKLTSQLILFKMSLFHFFCSSISLLWGFTFHYSLSHYPWFLICVLILPNIPFLARLYLRLFYRRQNFGRIQQTLPLTKIAGYYAFVIGHVIIFDYSG